MSLPHAQPGEINADYVDRFTLLHIASGVALHRLRVQSPWVVLIAAVGFEVLEPKLKEWKPGIFPHPTIDSPRNKVVDALAVVAGWYASRAIG